MRNSREMAHAWGSIYAAFTEFDCGTVNDRQLRAKFGEYHGYLASGAYRDDFEGLPTVLVVTTSEPAERRIAREVREVERGRPGRLPLLLTNYKALLTADDGMLGEIWWRPGTPQTQRRRWFDVSVKTWPSNGRKAS